MSTTAIVPLRSPGAGKTRLQDVLDVHQRALLSIAMFDDVIAALRASCVDQIVVAANGARAFEHAHEQDLAVIPDGPSTRSLNDALAAILARVQPTETALVVAADLPLLTSLDVNAVLDRPEAVVVAPTRRGGTGGLSRRPPDCVATHYGVDSAARHLQSAASAGLTASQCDRTGFYFDIDVSADLDDLRQWLQNGGQRLGNHTRRVLRELSEVSASASSTTLLD